MSGTLIYGLTPGGFVRMRLPEIRRAIFDDARVRLGQPLDETPDSVSGQLVAVFADREAALWEIIEAVYLSAYPATAVGVALDYAVSYAGVRRIQEQPSSAVLRLTGTQGTVVPAGTVIDGTIIADGADREPRFSTVADLTITRNATTEIVLRVTTVTASTAYWIEINGSRFEITADGTPSGPEIATALAGAIGGRASVSASDVTIRDDTPMLVDWSTRISLQALSGDVLAESLTAGAVVAVAGSLTRIATPVAGLSAARNPASAVVGKLLETDEQLRARYETGVYRLGAATLDAIRANIAQDIEGQTSLAVFQNSGDVTDADGRLPHSVEVVIEGGDDDDIARAVFALTAAGIATHGNTLRTVIDGAGFALPVRFSRPEPVWIWLRISITANTEEALPGNNAELVREEIVRAGNALGVGRDVLLQRLSAGAVQMAGNARIAITAVATAPNAGAPGTGAYGSADIVVGSRQRAAFDVSRAVVI